MKNHKTLDKSFFQNGENYNVEFKSRLSPKDKSLLKTIVAFANCDGGKVVFGIDDETCSVIGIKNNEFDGPLDRQIENAMTFLLQHINVAAKIDGLLRKDIYEFPVHVLRELVINAVVHRNYLSHSFIQISIFDDRIEITNPGGLYGGITLEKILKGTSSIRNQILADIFSKMNLIEHWGTGIKRICDVLKSNKLSQPKFEADKEEFKVILYRVKMLNELPQSNDEIAPKYNKLPQSDGKIAPKHNKLPQSDDEIALKLPNSFTKNTILLYDAIKSDPSLTVQKLAVKTGLSERAVKYNLSILKKGKYIIREGTNRLGVWKVIK